MFLHACKWLLVVSKSQTEKTKEKKKRENRLTIATLPPRTLTLLTSALRHSGQSQFPSKHSPHTLSVFINLPLERRADNLEPHLCHLVNLTARGRGSELLQVRVHLSGPPAYQRRVYLKSTRSDGQQQTEGHTHAPARRHTHTHVSTGDQSRGAAISSSPRGRAAVMSALSLSIPVTMTRFSLEYCTVNNPQHLWNAAVKLCSRCSLMCMFT